MNFLYDHQESITIGNTSLYQNTNIIQKEVIGTENTKNLPKGTNL